MNTSRQGGSKLLTVLAFISVAFPVYFMGLWVRAFKLGSNQQERVEIFWNHFPDFLHGRFRITFLSIFLCALAIVLAAKGLKEKGKFWQGLNIIILAGGVMLLLWNVFQMM